MALTIQRKKILLTGGAGKLATHSLLFAGLMLAILTLF